MATRRATKKSSFTQNTRRGKKPSRNSIQEEDKDEGIENESHSMNTDTEAEDSEESQGIAGEPLQQLIGTMVSDQRKRFDARKKAVNNSYTADCKAIQDLINTVFNEHEERSSSAHRAQMKRLQELVAQKAKIEAAMAKKQASLRAAYDAHSLDLEAVLNRRIKDLD